jgi:DNA-binding PadR family transcriptional regulator
MGRPLARMREKVLKENLWYFVLQLLRTKSRYGFEIRGLVRKRFGFWPGNVTAYKVLYDLAKDGYVRAEKRFYKKRYTITAKGIRELVAAKKFLKKIAK